MKYTFLLVVASFFFVQCKGKIVDPPEPSDLLEKSTITFKSTDDLMITADTYLAEANTEFILLCHQAGYSRGEYKDTAKKFGEKGYNCMAIDQRSGDFVNGVTNETAKAALAAGLATDYLGAKKDIIAAIDKAYTLNGNKPIFLLGSSYSSVLSLLIAKDNPKVKAVAAFSPGEYLSGTDVAMEMTGYAKPVFATSSKVETNKTANLVANIDAQYLTHFKSEKAGIHGASCLWESTAGSAEYWVAILDFWEAHK